MTNSTEENDGGELQKELNRIYRAINWRLHNGINQGAPERQWLKHQQEKLEGVLDKNDHTT